MALNHELRFVEVLGLEVVDIDRSIGLVLCHHGSVLPGEEVLRALGWIHFGVERTELEAIEL
jgi:hypothetical protein